MPSPSPLRLLVEQGHAIHVACANERRLGTVTVAAGSDSPPTFDAPVSFSCWAAGVDIAYRFECFRFLALLIGLAASAIRWIWSMVLTSLGKPESPCHYPDDTVFANLPKQVSNAHTYNVAEQRRTLYGRLLRLWKEKVGHRFPPQPTPRRRTLSALIGWNYCKTGHANLIRGYKIKMRDAAAPHSLRDENIHKSTCRSWPLEAFLE